MKYQNWAEYDAEKKLKALYQEAKLETNNGTTKQDLTNIVKFAAKEIFNLDIRLDFSNSALSEIREWCIEFEAMGLEHNPEEAKRFMRRIYEIAHDRLEEEAE
jgi:hypothetical protein